jgi:hypothetical protein
MKKQVRFFVLCLVAFLHFSHANAQTSFISNLLKKELGVVAKEGFENICNWLSHTYIQKSQQEAVLLLRAKTVAPFYSSKGHVFTHANEFKAYLVPLYHPNMQTQQDKLHPKLRNLADESLLYVQTHPYLDAQYPHRLDHHLNQRLPGTAYSTLKLKEKGLDLHYSYETQRPRWDNVLKTTGAVAGTGYAARKVKTKTGRQ